VLARMWHTSKGTAAGWDCAIVFANTTCAFFFFFLKVCCHAIFTICDVHFGKSNRNSSLKLNFSKPFQMQGGVQAVAVNGSF